jgi:hypothetical protein
VLKYTVTKEYQGERKKVQKVLQCDGRIEEYLADFAARRVTGLERCPECGCLKFYRWGSYKRNVVDKNKEYRIPVRRMRCANCRKTISFLPDFCVSRAQYSAGYVIQLISWALGLLGAESLAPDAPDARENLRRRAYFYRERFVRTEELWRKFLHRFGVDNNTQGGFGEIVKALGSLWREGKFLYEFYKATGTHFMAK